MGQTNQCRRLAYLVTSTNARVPVAWIRDRIYDCGMSAGTSIDLIVTQFLEDHVVQDFFNKDENPFAVRAAAAAQANRQTADEQTQGWRASQADFWTSL